MKFDAQDVFALTLAIALHVLVVAMLWFGAPSLFQQQAQIVPIKAVFLDTQRQHNAEQARLQAEAEARRKAEEEAKRKAAEEQARLKAEEEARKKAEAEARRKAEEEAKRKAEEQARLKAEEEARQKAEAQARRKAEEEARKKAEAEARRKAEEAARKKAEAEARRKAEELARKKRQEDNERRMREALAAEEAAIQAEREAAAQAKRDATDRERYQRQLFEHIQRHWSRPAGVDEDFSCRIQISQLPGGQIQNFKLLQSCGNNFLDASVEKAIRSADPLPLPENKRVFERTLTLIFQP